MHQHEHAAHGVEIEPGTPAWSEWVKDYYRDVETYDWVDVADNLRGLEAFFHRNRAWVVRKMVAKYATPNAPILDAGCGTGLNLRHLPAGSTGGPMTYLAKGKQYIVVPVGERDHEGELVAIALP